MARGDYFTVVYRTGIGTEREVISARRVGGSVTYDEPREKDLFVEVREVNKAGETVQTARFAKNDVVAILQGNMAAIKAEVPARKAK